MPLVADSRHFDKEQNPDPHQTEKSDPHHIKWSGPDPHQSAKADPDPHQSHNSDPDPYHNGKASKRCGSATLLPVYIDTVVPFKDLSSSYCTV
jgi:hypothetical protein